MRVCQTAPCGQIDARQASPEEKKERPENVYSKTLRTVKDLYNFEASGKIEFELARVFSVIASSVTGMAADWHDITQLIFFQ